MRVGIRTYAYRYLYSGLESYTSPKSGRDRQLIVCSDIFSIIVTCGLMEALIDELKRGISCN